MRMSASIEKLAPAFVKAQREVEGARKDKANPHLKSKYADLSSVWDACRLALQLNDLAVVQMPVSSDNGVGVETMLVHVSGEWLAESFTLPFPVRKDGSIDINAQAGGSCITYARRYALAALMGVCPEDDDGNAAADAGRKRFEELMLALKQAAAEGTGAYQEAWGKLSPEGRKAVGTLNHNSFKAQASVADARKQVNGKQEVAHATA